MFCPKCGAEIQDGNEFCNQCGFKIIEQNTATTESYKTGSNGESKHRNYFREILIVIIGLILIGTSIYCYKTGFDKKNSYYNDSDTGVGTNNYVGGDAYNYIINGTYFDGYMTLGSGLLIGGIVMSCTGLILGANKFKKGE